MDKIEADSREVERNPIGDTEVRPGEWIKDREAGGGGYGNALDRDRELVREHALEKWNTLDHARAAYGVVLEGSPDYDDLRVDVEATNRLRATLQEPR